MSQKPFFRDKQGRIRYTGGLVAKPEQFGYKQGRFITKDGRVIFIGGPGSGSGNSSASDEGFTQAQQQVIANVLEKMPQSHRDAIGGLYSAVEPINISDENAMVAVVRLNASPSGRKKADVTLYTETDGNYRWGEEIVAHEFGHAVLHNNRDLERRANLLYADLLQKTTVSVSPVAQRGSPVFDKVFLSAISQKDAHEMFAEGYSNYLFHPETLKATMPDLYTLISEQFNV